MNEKEEKELNRNRVRFKFSLRDKLRPRLNIPRIIMVTVFPHVCVRKRGKNLTLMQRSYQVRMLAFGTVVKNLILLFFTMQFPHDVVRGRDKDFSLDLHGSSLGVFPQYDERGDNICFH